MWREICVAALAFVIVFWNVENFFDPFDDPLKNDDEFTPRAARHWTWGRFEAKRNGLAKALLATADISGDFPDIIGIAEVENSMVVWQLVNNTPLAELDYGYVHRESPDARGIDVAMLYRKDRFKVLAVDSLRVPGFVTRDILYVKGLQKLSGDTLHFFTVHLPSKRGSASSSDVRREAALQVLRNACDSLLLIDNLSRIVAMGDFNDTYIDASPLKGASFEKPVKVGGTIKYHGVWEQIDHFFISLRLLESSKARILELPMLLERDDAYLGIKPRRTFIGPRHNGGLSDHLPILLLLGDATD